VSRRGPSQGALALCGRTAIVTGGGSGIGRGIALALARRGANLALVGRRRGRLEAVAGEAAKYHVRVVAIPADLSIVEERDGLLARVREELSAPVLLVHAAGALAGGSLLSLATQQLDQAIALNLAAPLALTRAAFPELAAEHGAIIFVASLASSVPHPYAATYSATKAGLAAFGEALRHEVAPLGVQILVAYPPGTATAMTRGMARAAGFPGHRLADPDQIGERIVAALLAGRQEWRGGTGERMLALAYRLAPALVRAALRSQHGRFRRMMSAPAEEQ
jgi:short-subunit dehydrogenase